MSVPPSLTSGVPVPLSVEKIGPLYVFVAGMDAFIRETLDDANFHHIANTTIEEKSIFLIWRQRSTNSVPQKKF